MNPGKTRGSALLAALLLLSVLLVLGLASLTKGVARQRTLAEARDFAKARQIAEAGLEDARAKLCHDASFPPVEIAPNQIFSYTEQFAGLDGTVLGFYTVTLDGRYAEVYQVYRIESVGRAGSDIVHPLAEARVGGDFDISPVVRGSTADNPFFYKFRTRHE